MQQTTTVPSQESVSQESVSQESVSQESRDRRATVRYHCAPATLGKVISTTREDFIRGFVLDLSKTGVGLLTSKDIRVGQVITVQICSPTTLEKHEFQATVAHITEQPHGDWKVGCEFFEHLSDDQLDQLL
ncbi:MAG: PilZ domain-containing protein [Gemmataceae bacterium]